MPGGAPGQRLRAIEGSVPLLGALPPGCAFNPRCPDRFEPCTDRAAAGLCRRTVDRPRSAICTIRSGHRDRNRTIESAIRDRLMPLVEVSHLVKHFTRDGGLFRAGTRVAAVDDVSFSIDEGETFGLVGESGSGKTTTGRCMLRLIEPTSGDVRFRGEDVLAFSRRRTARGAARHADRLSGSVLVAQPADAGAADRRGAAHHPQARRRAPTRRERVAELFRLVGLDPAHLERYPHQFSGGQRQRIGLARALALNPSFVILDEPVSALDVSVQAQVVNLLMDLQQRLKLTYLFIAHDLRLVEHICSRVAVMYLGKIVEMGPTASLFAAPQHPYTQGAAVGDPGAGSGRAAAAHRSRSRVGEPRRAAEGDRRGPLGGSVKVKTRT